MNTNGVHSLIKSEPLAAALFESLSGRRRRRTNTSIQSLLLGLRKLGAKAASQDLRHLLMKLELLGCGRYLVGRRGYASRFVWATNVVDIVSRVKPNGAGQPEMLTPKHKVSAIDMTVQSMYPHRYETLDRGAKFDFVLPVKVSKVKADAIAEFIATKLAS